MRLTQDNLPRPTRPFEGLSHSHFVLPERFQNPQRFCVRRQWRSSSGSSPKSEHPTRHGGTGEQLRRCFAAHSADSQKLPAFVNEPTTSAFWYQKYECSGTFKTFSLRFSTARSEKSRTPARKGVTHMTNKMCLQGTCPLLASGQSQCWIKPTVMVC